MKFGMFLQNKLPRIRLRKTAEEKQRGRCHNKKKIKMSKKTMQGRKKKHSKKITRKI